MWQDLSKVLIPDLKKFLTSFSFEKLLSQVATLTAIVRTIPALLLYLEQSSQGHTWHQHTEARNHFP